MKDDNWDLINGPIAHEIEVLNYSNQINNIECIVKLLTHQGKEQATDVFPSEMALKELHRTGTIFLLQHPGYYRDVEVHVGNEKVIVHQPPPCSKIQMHITDFFETLGKLWPNSTPLELASYALWRINWIHPFKNGNGRCARAFAYTCLCLKYGFMLPGNRTIIDLIMVNKITFQNCLKEADTAYESNGEINISSMIKFLEELLILQLKSSVETEKYEEA
ncbi:Fic family protein [Stappia taiwanensis]|uniref:Fic family protein n=1 Tax=Stappia taiwanensis TaxID=992267 RepID=A0A838XPV4_9HYPH|nr:Fic family protein [Stappia taiwanensis]MBA4610758.1 Fic family protein [Stappia taiwanensis]